MHIIIFGMISTFKQVEMTRWVCEKPMKGSFDNAEISFDYKGPYSFLGYIYTLKASKKNMVILYTMPYLQGLKRRKGLYIAYYGAV